MKKPFFKNKKAIGLIEIVIAVIIVVGAGIPILKNGISPIKPGMRPKTAFDTLLSA